RTMLILDIFAARAKTAEGKLQVELAQLRYMLPRLTGKGIELSRLGGGIGTRGPGETKLETDRRHIRRRIEHISEKMDEVDERRERVRARRRKTGVVTAAIVGYTNAGKSTLLNCLTGAGVLTENRLFATLDPTARALTLPSGAEVLLVDTVGFIRRLPHHLIKAFRSTLGEAGEADMILLVLDSADPDVRSQMEVTKNLLAELGAGDKPTVVILNKSDIADPSDLCDLQGVRISAAAGQGIDNLLRAIDEANPRKMVRLELLLPFDMVSLAAEIRGAGDVLEEEYTDGGLRLTALCDPAVAGRVKKMAGTGRTDR
ncbi:MAG: GTPase HflX, partial [Oscillospiraceae bacterium]|nr:GTPase HflX [Oscillospiraceae bacterium]